MDKAEDIVKRYEGCKLAVYKDLAGWLTAGWGHKLLPQDKKAFPTGMLVGRAVTQEQAEEWLRQDIAKAVAGIKRDVHLNLNDNQLAALTSLVFNIGIGAFGRSTLLDCLNTNRLQQASEEFLRYDHAGGVSVPGLLSRRREEQALFLLPQDHINTP